ncbi:hypothetical protein M2454_001916 [Aequitasia blattaphilus]|nr:hypothetical protein [Aequitasia blattaphilus]
MSEYRELENKYSKEYKRSTWDMAIGLQAVDELEPSEYLQKIYKL